MIQRGFDIRSAATQRVFMCCVSIALFAVSTPTSVLAASNPNPTSVANAKAANDTDPHVPMPAAMQQRYVAKQAQANAFYAQYFGSHASHTRTYIYACCNTPPVSKDLPGNQMTQKQNTWCGPAAMTEVILGLGTNSNGGTMSMDQPTAANIMYTGAYDNDNDDGTAWSGVNANVPNPTAHPMLDLYNYEYYGTTNGSMYQVSVNYYPTSSDQSNFVSNLTFDIWQGYPLIGDAWEQPGGYYLVGHPTNVEIMHWFKIRGYWQSGATTDYEDSESGAESLSGWTPGSVPPYSSYNTNHLVQILGGRGYIW